jgi:hypothetical protein
MTFGRGGCEIGVVAIICVLMVFFFPAMEGPYSAVHGPATAFQAAAAAARVRTGVVRGGFDSLGNWLNSSLTVPYRKSFPNTKVSSGLSPGFGSIFRC